MAWIKSFAAFVLLQVFAWGGAHFYYSTNPKQVLLVVDTSYAMKPHFSEAQSWIDDFVGGTRYTHIEVGTDKVALGDLADLRSRDILFRTAFGRISTENVAGLYSNVDVEQKYLLTSDPIELDGWTVVSW